MTLRDLQLGPLRVPYLEIARHEAWCLLGCNASGKSLLGRIVAGEAQPERGCVEDAPQRPALLSFETQQTQYERALAEDDTDYLDHIDYGPTGRALLLESGCAPDAAAAAAQRFELAYLLDRGSRQFSSGELRKIQLLRAALSGPDLLVLDEPYEGLDARSREEVNRLAQELLSDGVAILLIANRLDDVAPWATHLAVLQKGELAAAGPKQSTLARPEVRQLLEIGASPPPTLPEPKDETFVPDPLVRLRAGAARYADFTQFQGLDWTLNGGEHTLITGPNGCGKSTLLGLVTGDHPQCYSNDLEVLGFRRGSGESIWQVKARLGIVSPALHRDYRVNCSILDVAVSGFFDSIGLYEQPSRQQVETARAWLRLFGLESEAAAPFRSLSYGQQRLALVARALVKQPPLLILDEPTQGLDDLNRRLVLACIDRLAALRGCTLLFVSHREDERLPLFRAALRFEPDPSGATRFRVRQESL